MTSEKTSVTDASNVRFLTVTANTGTVFEKVCSFSSLLRHRVFLLSSQPELLTAWVSEFANVSNRTILISTE